MVNVDRQVHGYRQGHQLLAASSQLPKPDQSVVDRLSDVAGPLRPREMFEPYLSVYPLPSEERVVMARTWQDTTIARAGCVRTLSLIIGTEDWSHAENLAPFLELLETDELPGADNATLRQVSTSPATPLPPAPNFSAGELLEALFLEETRPVVVFDTPPGDLIALRLLTALWPSMRRRFAVSTFALSPRKVGGRDFDLVFAPKDAKGRFSDWNGRRIDGRSNQGARHRWTNTIVDRVFERPYPQLLTETEIGLVGGDSHVDEVAALRIALLWDELFRKLERTPAAALGLLDIANSGKVRDAGAVGSLEPVLASAVRRASTDLPEAEAWDFLSAIAAKMRTHPMPIGKNAVGAAAETLSARFPDGAIALLVRQPPAEAAADLLPRIAHGLGGSANGSGERALLSAPPELLLQLVAADGLLTNRVAANGALIERVGAAIGDQDSSLIDAVSRSLLPHLVEDWQLPAARPLIARLDAEALAREIAHLGATNNFEAGEIAELVIERARIADAKKGVRASIVTSPPSVRRNALLARMIDPVVADVAWLLDASGLAPDLVTSLLISLSHAADNRQLSTILGQPRLGDEVLTRIEGAAPDILERIVLSGELPIDAFVRVVGKVLPKTNAATRHRVAEKALLRCLPNHFDGDEREFLTRMMGIVGESLDGTSAVRVGLGHDVPASVANRNMLVFRDAPSPAHHRIVRSIAELAEALCDRKALDLNQAALEACAHLMFEAERAAPGAMLDASGLLMPVLMQHPREPVSLLVAAAFPMVYRELAKADDVPDLLKFIPFLDWDRCKAARRELVSTFMESSSWSPADLALTACRCGDVGRILRRAAKSYGGDEYIERIEKEAYLLPEGCRLTVEQTILHLKSNTYEKFNWRD